MMFYRDNSVLDNIAVPNVLLMISFHITLANQICAYTHSPWNNYCYAFIPIGNWQNHAISVFFAVPKCMTWKLQVL